MTQLQTALQVHHQAVDAFLTAARTVQATQWDRPRAPGKWSPAQVAEHLALAYEVNRGVLHGSAPGPAAPRFLRPLIRKFGLNPLLRRGSFTPGSKSPKVFRPSASPAGQAELLARLQAAANAFELDAAAATGPGATIDHPFFGRLPLLDFVRLQEIHARHHLAQVRPDAR
jgi:DinB family protein